MPAARKNVTIVGVELAPRDVYVDRQMQCVAATEQALTGGRWDPSAVPQMPPRCMPVYEDEAGNRFIINTKSEAALKARQSRLTEATAKLRDCTKPDQRAADDEWGAKFFGGVRQAAEDRAAELTALNSDRLPPLIPVKTSNAINILAKGGIEGGFLSISSAPPLPVSGGSGASWMRQFIARLPRQVDLTARQENWTSATQEVANKVGKQTNPLADEWRQQYFSGVREAAAQRDPIYQSPDAKPRGAGHFTKDAQWNADDFRQSAFNTMRASGEKSIANLLAFANTAIAGQFAPRPAGRDGMAEFLAKMRSFGPLGDLLMQRALPKVKALSPELFKAMLADKAQAAGGKGKTVSSFQQALDIITQLNDSGVTSLLAALADKALFPFEPLTTGCLEPNNLDMSVVMDNFASKLSGFGIDKGLDALIGKVTDKSPLLQQLAAKYKDQISGLAKKLLSAKGREDLQKQIDELFNGAKSTANVMVGSALPGGGANIVLYNKLPAARLNDICDMPWSPDAGPYKMGNPTVLTNGQPTTGHIHIAVGDGKKTVATPARVCGDVLMSEATFSLKIEVDVEAPKATNGRGSSSGPQGQSKGSGGNKAGGKKGNAEGQGGQSDQSKQGEQSKPQLTDEERKRYQELSEKDNELARQQKEVFEKADRGEMTSAAAQAEAERLMREREELNNQLEGMRSRTDSSQFDADGYLRDNPPANVDSRSQESTTPDDSQLTKEQREAEAKRLRRDIRRMEGQSDIAALFGQDRLSEQFAATADAARIRAAQLEGGLEAAARESAQITARRAVELAIDKGLKLLPEGPVRMMGELVKLPLESGAGQLTEEFVEWLQDLGYLK